MKDRPVAVSERGEVMRLPIVACAGCQQRIEGLLPGGKRLHSDVGSMRRTELPERRDRALPRRRISGVGEGKRHHLPAVDRLRQEGEWRRLSQHDPCRQLVRCACREFAIELEHLPSLGDRVDDEAREQIGSDRLRLEGEAGGDREVAAPAAQAPEEIRVLTVAGRHDLACARICILQ